MKEQTPDISVVTAVYNGEGFLRQTLDSLLCQTEKNFEAIIIDDCSTDSTPEILKEYSEKDGRIRVFRNEQNMRLANSLNRGTELARGKYIARLDADDICLPNRFEKQLAFMESRPDVDLSFCKFFTLREGEILPCSVGRKTDADSVKAMFLFFCPVLHPGVIVKSSVMKKYKYDPSHTCSEDIDLWIRMLCDGVKIEGSGDYLMLYRIHGGSITANSAEKQKREVILSERYFYSKMLGEMPKRWEEFYINSVYFKEKFDRKRLYEFYRYIIRANRKTRAFKKSTVVSGTAEVLAEYNKSENLGPFSRLFMLKFGGADFVRCVFERKRRAQVDIDAAKKTARSLNFKQTGNLNGLPIYGSEKE